MQKIISWTSNLLALAGLVCGYLLARNIFHQDGILTLVLVLTGMAVLQWTLYRRKHERIRSILGWSYTGLVCGLGLATFLHWWNQGLWWLSLLMAPGVFLVAVTAPGTVNAQVWNIRLRRHTFPSWEVPQVQGRQEVLASGVLTLHEVVEITERLEGGVVQSRERKVQGFEVQFQQEPLFSGDRKDAEEWLLARYRHYRTAHRLPISPELSPAETRTRFETLPVEQTLDSWAPAPWPDPLQVLGSSPYTVLVHSLTHPETPHVVSYGVTRQFVGHSGAGTSTDLDGVGLVDRAEVWLRDLKVAEVQTLEKAEQYIFQRYTEHQQLQKATRNGPAPSGFWTSSTLLSRLEVLHHQPYRIRATLQNGEHHPLSFNLQGEICFLDSTGQPSTPAHPLLTKVRWLELHDRSGLVAQFRTLEDLQDHLMKTYADLKDLDVEDL